MGWSGDQPRFGFSPGSSRVDRVDRVVGLVETSPRRSRQPVQRLVEDPVGVRVLRPRDPGVRRPGRRQPVGLHGQRAHVRVLDLPAAGHLLDDQLGVHAHLELGLGGVLVEQLEAGDEAAVLRDVVGGDPDGLGPLGDHLAGVRVEQHRAVGGRTRVAAGPAVGLDLDGAAHDQMPDSEVRTRIRLHSSQRSTSSSGAFAMLPRSEAVSSRLHPPQRRARRAAAPTPPFWARIFS